MVGRYRCAAENRRLSDPRQPHERELSAEREPTGVARDQGDDLTMSRRLVDSLESTHPGVQDVQLPVVPARGVRHRQSRGHWLP